MLRTIDGRHLAINENDDVLAIGFANHADQPSEYLLLQRSLAPSPQDKRLGLDKVYVEVNEQVHSVYGGISRVQLRSDHLLLKFNAQTAAKLGTAEELEVKLKLTSSEAEELRFRLQHLFGDELTLD